MDRSVVDVHEVRLWLALLGRGVAGVVFGMVLMAGPQPLIQDAAVWLLIYLLADGMLGMYAATRARRSRARPLLLALGALANGITAVLAAAIPTAHAVRLLTGARAIATGVCDARWSRHHRVSDLLTLGGVAAVALGIVLLLAWPGPGVQALPWLIGIQVMVSGALLTAGALSELRRVAMIVPQPV